MIRRIPLTTFLGLLVVGCATSEPSEDGYAGGAGADGRAGAAGSNVGGGKPKSDGGTDVEDQEEEETTCESGGSLTHPIKQEPLAAIVTSDALAPSFASYATLHTLLGMPTVVATTSEICAGQCNDADPKKDTASHIKKWLRKQLSVQYVILGGDIEHVPSRKVHDRYQNPLMSDYTFEADFHTDYYFADYSKWDTNGDGVYAQDGTDFPEYRPDVAVSRITASTPSEAERYYEKVRRYYTAYNLSHVAKVLMLSNVATQFMNVDIDGAWYFESEGKTLSLLPQGSEVRRLYSTGMAGAEKNSVAKQIDAIESGANLIVHSGHGTVKHLTAEYSVHEDMSGEMAHDLKNDTYPIFLSSACEAATFSADDSAGEMLMDAPQGGAIAYLGNSVTGLGLAGGMQMIDELLRYVRDTDHPLLADAIRMAHENMPKKDTFQVPGLNVKIPVVDQASYEWTQKSVTVFGDILIPVWKGWVEPAASVTASSRPTCEGTWIDLVFDPPVDGKARVIIEQAVLEVPVVKGKARLHAAGSPSSLTVGFAVPGRLATFEKLSL